MEQNQVAQAVAANNLSSATYLLNFLIRLWTDMVDEEFKVLENAISPIIGDSMEQVRLTHSHTLLHMINEHAYA